MKLSYEAKTLVAIAAVGFLFVLWKKKEGSVQASTPIQAGQEPPEMIAAPVAVISGAGIRS